MDATVDAICSSETVPISLAASLQALTNAIATCPVSVFETDESPTIFVLIICSHCGRADALANIFLNDAQVFPFQGVLKQTHRHCRLGQQFVGNPHLHH